MSHRMSLKVLPASFLSVVIGAAAAGVPSPARAEGAAAKDKASMVQARREKALQEAAVRTEAAEVAAPAAEAGSDKALLKAAVNDEKCPAGHSRTPKGVCWLNCVPPAENFLNRFCVLGDFKELGSIEKVIGSCADTHSWSNGECMTKDKGYFIKVKRGGIIRDGMPGGSWCGFTIRQHPEQLYVHTHQFNPSYVGSYKMDWETCQKMNPNTPVITGIKLGGGIINENQLGFAYARCVGFGKCVDPR